MSTRDLQAPASPTETEPSLGASSVRVAGEEIELSEGAWWIDESGDYIIRSLEFDVIAGAPTFEQALAAFSRNIVDFAIYLGELEDRADNEEEMFHRLAPRVLRLLWSSSRQARILDSRPLRDAERIAGLISA